DGRHEAEIAIDDVTEAGQVPEQLSQALQASVWLFPGQKRQRHGDCVAAGIGLRTRVAHPLLPSSALTTPSAGRAGPPTYHQADNPAPVGSERPSCSSGGRAARRAFLP